MIIKATCPNCGRKFSSNEALCKDWRDPNKRFGCPACGKFLRQKVPPTTSLKVALLIIICIITVSLANSWLEAWLEEKYRFYWLVAFRVILAVALFYLLRIVIKSSKFNAIFSKGYNSLEVVKSKKDKT